MKTTRQTAPTDLISINVENWPHVVQFYVRKNSAYNIGMSRDSQVILAMSCRELLRSESFAAP